MKIQANIEDMAQKVDDAHCSGQLYGHGEDGQEI